MTNAKLVELNDIVELVRTFFEANKRRGENWVIHDATSTAPNIVIRRYSFADRAKTIVKHKGVYILTADDLSDMTAYMNKCRKQWRDDAKGREADLAGMKAVLGVSK